MLPTTPETPNARDAWFGFRTPIEIVIAPNRAFAAVAASPEWLTAYSLIVASGLVAVGLSSAALSHVIAVTPPPIGLAGKPAAEIALKTKDLLEMDALDNLLQPLFWIGLSATVLTAIARFKGRDTSFLVYVALAANCLVPTIFGNLLGGFAAAIHPPGYFHDLRTLVIAAPDNLAILADPQNTKEVGFLGEFDIFTLWSTILLAFGFAATTPVKFNTALGVAFTLLLILASFPNP